MSSTHTDAITVEAALTTSQHVEYLQARLGAGVFLLERTRERLAALQARYDTLWQAQDEAQERHAALRNHCAEIEAQNETLRETVSRLTRHYDESVRPPADDCPPELPPCPLCGYFAWEINRAPENYQIACRRSNDYFNDRNDRPMDTPICCLMTGSYRTAAEAREVWSRRTYPPSARVGKTYTRPSFSIPDEDES